jgi:hypothetical protein
MVRVGVCCALFWLAVPGRAWTAPVAPDEFCYYYHKQRRPLLLDERRFAILQVPGQAADAKQALAQRLGVAETAFEALPIAGWSTVATQDKARSADVVKQLVQGAAGDRAVEFASPVFVDNGGGPIIVTPDILVGFGENVAADRAESILKQVAPGTIRDRDWTGMRGVYRVRSDARNGIAVLAAANALAQRAEVRFAEPDLIATVRHGVIPNDPGFPNCWGLHNTSQFGGTPDMDMDAPEAWDITTSNDNDHCGDSRLGRATRSSRPESNRRLRWDRTGDRRRARQCLRQARHARGWLRVGADQ